MKNQRWTSPDQLPYGVSTGALEAALEALLGVGAIEVTTGWELDESSEYGKAYSSSCCRSLSTASGRPGRM